MRRKKKTKVIPIQQARKLTMLPEPKVNHEIEKATDDILADILEAIGKRFAQPEKTQSS